MEIGKAVILTQPLHNNYGGLLQAFALQEVVRGLGLDVVTDFHPPTSNGSPVFLSTLSFLRNLAGRCLFKNDRTKKLVTHFPTKEQKRIISRHTKAFIDEHIRTIDFFQQKKTPTAEYIDSFDTYIVGSDQVWRPLYNKYPTQYFLDFLEGEKKCRIAYAASFGTDDWEYDSRLAGRCKELVQSFDAVSVREDSGVTLCKKHFDIDAEQLLDPTMLLPKERYIELVGDDDFPEGKKRLMTYVLDQTEDKRRSVDKVARELDLLPNAVMPSADFKVVGRNGLDKCVFPPVAQWLRGFMDSEFVITDSFHGAVFAIIFNKPFIVISNASRGKARFDSLLHIFGLGNQLISSSDELTYHRIAASIDWREVNNVLHDWQKKSIRFLEKNLMTRKKS